jgi:transposase-like protein
LSQEGLKVVEAFHRANQDKMYQEALEAEVDAFLGRSWHERTAGAEPGYRNGYYGRKMLVPGERLSVSIPRVRNTRRTLVSRVLQKVAHLADRVRPLALEAYVRGLSTRDIEQTFVDERGDRC